MEVIASKNKNNIIQTNIDDWYSGIDLNLINNKWNKFDFQKNNPTLKFSAVDGTFNKKNFMIGTLYAISSHAIYSKIEPGVESVSQYNDVDIIPGTISNVNQILSRQMNIMELHSMLDTLKNTDTDYILVDGSIYGTLSHIARGLNPSVKDSDYIADIREKVHNNINKNIPLTDIENYYPPFNNETIEYEDIMLHYLMFEQLEYLYQLLDNYSEKIICVSKTSTTRDIYKNKFISDACLIEHYCKESGFTSTKYIKDNRYRVMEHGHVVYGSYPLYDEFFSKQKFTTYFTKLTDKGSVLKIQLPYIASEDEVIDTCEQLHSISLTTTGYPYILEKAHDTVKISNKDIEKISRQLRLNYLKTGRDML